MKVLNKFSLKINKYKSKRNGLLYKKLKILLSKIRKKKIELKGSNLKEIRSFRRSKTKSKPRLGEQTKPFKKMRMNKSK